jgi:hypothetical protein
VHPTSLPAHPCQLLSRPGARDFWTPVLRPTAPRGKIWSILPGNAFSDNLIYFMSWQPYPSQLRILSSSRGASYLHFFPSCTSSASAFFDPRATDKHLFHCSHFQLRPVPWFLSKHPFLRPFKTYLFKRQWMTPIAECQNSRYLP